MCILCVYNCYSFVIVLFDYASKTLLFIGLLAYLIYMFVSYWTNFQDMMFIINPTFFVSLFVVGISVYFAFKFTSMLFYLSIYILGIAIGVEFVRLFENLNLEASILISVVLVLYAVICMFFGIYKKNAILKTAGIQIVLIAILKILFYDLLEVDMLFRVIAFMIVGVSLLGISSYYINKNNK